MIKKGDKLIIVCEALQDEISDTVLVKLNSSAQSSMVMLTENVKKAPEPRCNLKGITEEDFWERAGYDRALRDCGVLKA